MHSGKLSQEHTMRITWKRGFIRLILTGGIIWMLLILTVLFFHIWSCQSSVAFFSGKLFVCVCVCIFKLCLLYFDALLNLYCVLVHPGWCQYWNVDMCYIISIVVFMSFMNLLFEWVWLVFCWSIVTVFIVSPSVYLQNTMNSWGFNLKPVLHTIMNNYHIMSFKVISGVGNFFVVPII